MSGVTFIQPYLRSSNVILRARVFLKLVTNERLLFLVVSRGERQEFKFFDQMVQLFGNKYIINSDPVAEEAANGAGNALHCFNADMQFSGLPKFQLSCPSAVLLMFPPSNYASDTRRRGCAAVLKLF